MFLKILTLTTLGFVGSNSIKINHQQQKKYAWYYTEENPQHSCYNDYHCDGLRYCDINPWIEGQCLGIARPPKDKDYYYDETITGIRCKHEEKYRDYYCDGERTCSQFDWCQGIAR